MEVTCNRASDPDKLSIKLCRIDIVSSQIVPPRPTPRKPKVHRHNKVGTSAEIFAKNFMRRRNVSKTFEVNRNIPKSTFRHFSSITFPQRGHINLHTFAIQPNSDKFLRSAQEKVRKNSLIQDRTESFTNGYPKKK